MNSNLTINGITGTLTLGDIEEHDYLESKWRNGTALIAGQSFAVGGGWIDSEGNFAAYDWNDAGDLSGLAAAVGLDIDRGTEEGRANRDEMLGAIQRASEQAAK